MESHCSTCFAFFPDLPRLSCQLRGGRSETPQRDEAGEELSLWTRQSPNCLEDGSLERSARKGALILRKG